MIRVILYNLLLLYNMPPSKEEISKMEFQANLYRFGWDPEMIREVLNGN